PEEHEIPPSLVDHVETTQIFIRHIREATLDNGKLDQKTIHHLRDPQVPDLNFADTDVRLCMDIYIAACRSSEEVYRGVRRAIQFHFPETEPLSLEAIRKAVAEIAGVRPILDDICVNSCHAFVGDWADESQCKKCGADRWLTTTRGKRIPQKQMTTIPLGPQLAAL
ncbi:hypothetical protein DFP72DRAFT_790037, partial [Ephemerocybe angulata]